MNIKREALSNPKRRSEVLAASDLTTYGAQKEVLRMVQAHLSARYPHRFRDILSTNISSEVLGTEAVAGAEYSECAAMPPLEAAARLAQEDFVLMRRSAASPLGRGATGVVADDETYRSVAAVVVFSFGEVPRRVGQQFDLRELHAKVGSYEADLGRPVHRFMAGLATDRPAWRSNWSFVYTGLLTPSPDRYMTNLAKRRRVFPDAPEDPLWDGPSGAVRRMDRHGVGAAVWCKVEYQTLRRLAPPHDDYILFTVRTHIEPMSAFEGLPTASRCLADNVRRATRKEFRHYKGLSDSRIVDRILAFLESHSRDTPGPEEALGAPAARDGA